MFYEIAFMIHMLGLIGWGGLTTGAYYLFTFYKLTDVKILTAYRRLVYLEIISLIAMALSGLYMWSRLNYPSWVYPALVISPILAYGEYLHWRLTYVNDINTFMSKMKYLSLFYTVLAIFLIYDMVFKPSF
ncbi:hypothetical protein BFU36_11485 [Sulfolobus sp. A20]|uniref:hypothetical protein n=1 Tax=Sulfolobaceae TaxID=118883 RepID=UPI000846153D|nr:MULTISPECIES: hypothetical protein [unclassified Sulfolobus]TRM73724.1 hypothetical protein DJ523_06610 [Sulfolobus sp. E5]TRM74503.1 hypothetical protein DJ528_10335 [Sulfolobus sp. B5]TRM75710.1 hypothetical protein DJ532_09450 [Sulfolobus sp. A20-N-F8]TRM80988.1 hypothetical protein DJ531_11525 [Sulfolobus sp. A20-N-F6]TRM81360.1 hypothetical protein DJ524_04340 [Sulfolobus sp. D5]TRM83786.1 hypothetical protein DJ522_05795 [Sulfolobus sp. F3]TRM87178.1 hypothetical protein DJ529_09305